MSTAERTKITVPEISRRRTTGEKISMITAYDATFARLVDLGGVDMILVGNSVGMVVQGDVDLGSVDSRHVATSSDRSDREIDRIVDRATKKIELGGEDGETDPSIRAALVGAVAELVRAETGLASAKLDDATSPAMIKQAEQRRDLAKQAVERIADDARAEPRGNRDAIRQTIRKDIREEIRDAVRS